MNKTVHIYGAGGPAGVGLTRCLKEHYAVTGSDGSRWAKLMMECEMGDPEKADMCVAVPDSMAVMSSFRPDNNQLAVCQNKAMTAEILGDLAPKTYWVRDTKGSGGAGAQMASELLPGKNYSQEFVVLDGHLLAWFQKERISYSVKSPTKGTDNRGSSAVSICTKRREVFDIALEGLNEVAKYTGTQLRGFYGVDLKCDEEGIPKVTEINAGRLLTASYTYFHLTGYNLPLVGVKAYLGEEPPILPDYPEGWGIIRQVGQEPRLFPPEVTKDWL